ncbi:hypothetical protein [Clostridium sp. 1xD42-85]|uniref:hypothetical protein n=1 Tax=Clostridium sp. 1xD42-85 TaxID=2320084 RepID=UPI00257040C2|nr:hypothetical protein [Clostridium sp. 1xD42-85]
MSLPNEELVSLKKFYQMREQTDQLLEYIDGVVYMSPPTLHRSSAAIYAISRAIIQPFRKR